MCIILLGAGYFLSEIKGSRASVENKSFLSCVNRKQNFEIDSPASRGEQGKYTQSVSLSWSPLEAALPIFNSSIFFVKTFLRSN